MAGKPAFAWFGPASGILFVVLLGVAFATGGGANADPEGSAAEIAAELEAAQDGASAFSGYSCSRCSSFCSSSPTCATGSRASGSEGAWLVSVLWGSGLLFAAMALLIGSVQAAQFVVERLRTGHPSGQDAGRHRLGQRLLVLGPPVGAFGASAAVLILRFKVLPWWLGALAVLVSPERGFAPWMSPVVLLPWVVLTSIVLLVEERNRPNAANA